MAFKAKNQVAATEFDPTIIFVGLEIDDKTYRLAWKWGDIAQAEKDLGTWVEEKNEKGKVISRKFVRASLLTAVGDVIYNVPGFGQLGELLYAATRTAHPEMTIDQIGVLVRVDTVAAIKGALVSSWGASIPDRNDKKDPSEGGDQNES